METKNTIICSKCLEKIPDERICPLCGNDNSVDNPVKVFLGPSGGLQFKYKDIVLPYFQRTFCNA